MLLFWSSIKFSNDDDDDVNLFTGSSGLTDRRTRTFSKFEFFASTLAHRSIVTLAL